MRDQATRCSVLLTCALASGYVAAELLTPFFANQELSALSSSATHAVGDRVDDSEALPLSRLKATVVVVTSSTCSYCTKDMPFYRRLALEAERNKVNLVFVSNESDRAHKAYLAENGVNPSRLVALASTQLSIRGTPTIIVFVENEVRHSWLGELGDAAEEEVLRAVRQVAP